MRRKTVSFDKGLLLEYVIFIVGKGLIVNKVSSMKLENTQMVDNHNLNPNEKILL